MILYILLIIISYLNWRQSMEKRVMTVALNELEMQVLEKLAERRGLTKVGVLRQALRAYQLLDERAKQGQKLFLEDPITKEKTELALMVA